MCVFTLISIVYVHLLNYNKIIILFRDDYNFNNNRNPVYLENIEVTKVTALQGSDDDNMMQYLLLSVKTLNQIVVL